MLLKRTTALGKINVSFYRVLVLKPCFMRKSTLKFYKVHSQLIIFGFSIYTNEQYYDKYYWTMKVMSFSTLSESESCLDFVLRCLYDRIKSNGCYKTSYNKVIYTVVIRNHCDCLTNGNGLQVNKTVWKWNTIHTRWFIYKKINGKIAKCIHTQ